MDLDPASLFLTLIATTTVIGLLVLWVWRMNRPMPVLKVWGIAYLLGAAALVLAGGRGRWPDFLTSEFAGSITLAAFMLMWSSLRTFNRHPLPFRMSLLTVAAWLATGLFVRSGNGEPLRFQLFSVECGVISLLIAAEFLRSSTNPAARLSACMLATGHGTFLFFRAVMLAIEPAPMLAWQRRWFLVSTIETMFFVIASAVFLLSLVMARLAQEHRERSEQDYLTGAASRLGFDAAIPRLLRNPRRQRQPSAVILFDLDRFKQVNDTLGHKAGDRVLKLFGTVARESLRETDLVARFGGDEFIVLLPGLDALQANEIAQRIVTRFTEACHGLEGMEALAAGASHGVAIDPCSDGNLSDLINAADRALYQQKKQRQQARTTAPAEWASPP